jgi:micrococcal nuclease
VSVRSDGRRAVCLLASAVALATSGCAVLEAPRAADEPAGARQRAEVLAVTDGDTIRVSLNGRTERIRMALLDAPEASSTRYGRPECGGSEATRRLENLLDGGRVTLTRPSSENRDKFGRLVREVRVDGRSVDEQMIRGGWAKPYRVPAADGGAAANRRIARAAATAKRKQRGVWALCGRFGRPQ